MISCTVLRGTPLITWWEAKVWPQVVESEVGYTRLLQSLIKGFSERANRTSVLTTEDIRTFRVFSLSQQKPANSQTYRNLPLLLPFSLEYCNVSPPEVNIEPLK